jgi:hypothetical protein
LSFLYSEQPFYTQFFCFVPNPVLLFCTTASKKYTQKDTKCILPRSPNHHSISFEHLSFDSTAIRTPNQHASTNKRLPSSTSAPLCCSSPCLLERNRNKTSLYKRPETSAIASSAVPHTGSSGAIVHNNKLPTLGSKKPTNPPIVSHQRGKNIGNAGRNIARGEGFPGNESVHAGKGEEVNATVMNHDNDDNDNGLSQEMSSILLLRKEKRKHNPVVEE